MLISSLFRTLILMAALGVMTLSARADTFQLISLSGFVDPITYTTAEGTFTTGPILLTLSASSPSFFTIDTATGLITSHTVMDLSFNNGQPGALNQVLSGTITVDESGMLGPQPIPMVINGGVLTGAGPFAGTSVSGENPTRFETTVGGERLVSVGWDFRFVEKIFVTLPSGFQGETHIAIHGRIDAVGQPVPEPSSILLLGAGLSVALTAARRRRKGDTGRRT